MNIVVQNFISAQGLFALAKFEVFMPLKSDIATEA
jgi:hypothetical protein